jgi:hypothetical protein
VGNHLRIILVATGETITVANQLATPAWGIGIEALSFRGGVTFDRAAIIFNLQPACPIIATAGADVLSGSSDNETLLGMDGDGMLCGLGGADMPDGGDGNDTFVGGAGADRFRFDILGPWQ